MSVRVLRNISTKPPSPPEPSSVASIGIDINGKHFQAVERARWRLLKKSLSEQFRRAGFVIIDGASHILIERMEDADGHPARGLATLLTGRELQIATMITEGKCDKEIARDLGISDYTVREHLRRMFHKLKVSKRTALVAFVVKAMTP